MKTIEQLQTTLALWETRREHLKTSLALAQYQMRDIELEIAKAKKTLEESLPDGSQISTIIEEIK